MYLKHERLNTDNSRLVVKTDDDYFVDLYQVLSEDPRYLSPKLKKVFLLCFFVRWWKLLRVYSCQVNQSSLLATCSPGLLRTAKITSKLLQARLSHIYQKWPWSFQEHDISEPPRSNCWSLGRHPGAKVKVTWNYVVWLIIAFQRQHQP